MKFLKDAHEQAFAPKMSIINRLIDGLGGYEPARSHEVVHASDITKESFCPRQTALLDLTKGKKKDEWIEPAMRVTFDTGNVMADLFREKWGSGWVYGDWECVRCGAQRTFCVKPVCPCPAAKGLMCSWRYREMNFVSKTYDVSGSLDSVCDLGSPQLFVTELKIIAPTEFEKIVAPLPEHRIRTSLYLKLVEDSNSAYKIRLNLQKAKVLYISRAYGKKHDKYGQILPFKEFDVARDDKALGPALEKAKKVKEWRTLKKMPAGVCATSADKLAKQCSMCSFCFSGKYPVSV